MHSTLRSSAVRLALSAMLTFILAGCGGGSSNSNFTPVASGGSTASSASEPTTGTVAVTTTVAASKAVPSSTRSLRITLTRNDGTLLVSPGLTNPSTFPASAGTTQTNAITNVPAGAYNVLTEALDGSGNVLGVNAQVSTVLLGRTASVRVTTVQDATSVTVSPSTATVGVAGTKTLSATATLTDGSTAIVTVLGTWSSSATSVATVSNVAGSQGTVSGVAPGTSTVAFTYQGSSASATITVSGAAPSPSPSPSASPSPSPTTVNTTISNTTSFKLRNQSNQLNSSARKPGANQTGTYVYVGDAGTIVTSDDAQTQFTYQSSGVTSNLNQVIWVGNVGNIAPTNQNSFYSVGTGTTILSSPDGVTWTQQSLAANATLDAALGNDTHLTGITVVTNGAQGSGFLICGGRAHNQAGQKGTILFTTDLKDATKYVDLSFGVDVDYTACACGLVNNAFIFEVVSPVGANGSAVHQVAAADTAPTAAWTANASAAHPMAFVAYCNADSGPCFIAAGTNAARVFGLNVTAGGQGWANNVSTNTGAFDGGYQLTNATTLDATGIALASIGIDDVAVIVGNTATGPLAVTTTTFPSPSGASWTTAGVSFKFSPTEEYVGATAIVSGILGDTGAPNLFTVTAAGSGVLSATDGKAYTVKSYTPAANINAACLGSVSGANLRVMVGSKDPIRNTPTIMTSTDGVTWTQRVSTVLTTQSLNAVVQAGPANGLRFVAVGNGALATSTDGVTWTGSTTELTQNYNGVAYGNGKFVAVGASGWVQTSTDGLTWTAGTQIAGNPYLESIAFGAGKFVACGFGEIFNSTDGVTWTPAASSGIPSTPSMPGIVYTGTTFIAVDEDGMADVSTDGSTFTRIPNVSAQPLFGVAFVSTPNGSGATVTVIAVGKQGVIATSTDLGQTWTTTTSPYGGFLRAVLAGSTSTTSFDPGTNVTTNTYTQFFETGAGNTTILQSR